MAAPHNSADSPVMRQYLEIKSRYPDSVLFFRMGDFYELFFEDAVTVGPVLDIAVTSRDRNTSDPVPMAGVPYHAVAGYLRTMVERGFKVAICEQMETPEQARKRKGPKIVRREVVRVVSPGALVDEEHLEGKEPNYLVALRFEGTKVPGPAAFAALDISSGEFTVGRVADAHDLRAELARLAPRELLVAPEYVEPLSAFLSPAVPRLESGCPAPSRAQLQRVDALRAEGGGDALDEFERETAAWALGYAESTQPGQTLLIHRLRRHEGSAHLRLDETSLRNLEVFRTLREGKRQGSLLWAVDATTTAMGGRLLRQWLGAPSRDVAKIRRRHDGVEALVGQPRLIEELRSRLRDVRDVVRLATRARLGTISPRELAALRRSLHAAPKLSATLQTLAQGRTDRSLPEVLDLGEDLLADLASELERVLVDDPPAHTREGGMIRSSADPELAEQRGLRDGGRDALAAIEAREREATGIPNLKIQHNRVFGYFLEVSKSHVTKVPKDWVRKQTLANAERYVTDELAKLEAKILDAQGIALAREHAMFDALRAEVSEAGERLVELGLRLARVDVVCGLAQVAHEHDFTRPEVVEEARLDIEEGRHPVVERMLGSGRFVPNDTRLLAKGPRAPADASRLWVVTGPNMGGKSTVMRQVALITILAHAGSFVPAKSATIGLCDRVFTRVGAADDLGRGESTFMVEMRETAQILAQASERSLVLLDEIGRGTATFDGLALAWAITEHLHDQVGCRTMFATHYHELCGLAAQLEGVHNVHVAVHESRGRIVFLHRVDAGAAGRSYGIQVGRLAGLPGRVLRRATRILERLEAQPRLDEGAQLDLFSPRPGAGEASAPADEHPVLDRLRDLELDELSPRQAFEELQRLQEELD